MDHLRQLDPGLRFSASGLAAVPSPEDLAIFADGLRKAGLPE